MAPRIPSRPQNKASNRYTVGFDNPSRIFSNPFPDWTAYQAQDNFQHSTISPISFQNDHLHQHDFESLSTSFYNVHASSQALRGHNLEVVSPQSGPTNFSRSSTFGDHALLHNDVAGTIQRPRESQEMSEYFATLSPPRTSSSNADPETMTFGNREVSRDLLQSEITDVGAGMRALRSAATGSSAVRSAGVRKKNAKIDVPQHITLENIDELIKNAPDEEKRKELKALKRLLKNRDAALLSRQRKKDHTAKLQNDKEELNKVLERLQKEVDNLRARQESFEAERQTLKDANARAQKRIEQLEGDSATHSRPSLPAASSDKVTNPPAMAQTAKKINAAQFVYGSSPVYQTAINALPVPPWARQSVTPTRFSNQADFTGNTEADSMWDYAIVPDIDVAESATINEFGNVTEDGHNEDIKDTLAALIKTDDSASSSVQKIVPGALLLIFLTGVFAAVEFNAERQYQEQQRHLQSSASKRAKMAKSTTQLQALHLSSCSQAAASKAVENLLGRAGLPGSALPNFHPEGSEVSERVQDRDVEHELDKVIHSLATAGIDASQIIADFQSIVHEIGPR